tara:strand:+ start:347 stop:541 length:195 start_codon:yes stop_codon:yes gene_type:complete
MKSPEQIRERIEEIRNPNMNEWSWAQINALEWVLSDVQEHPGFVLDDEWPEADLQHIGPVVNRG